MDTPRESRPFWHGGLRFSCTSCGHCCRHEPGYVFLSESDLDALAAAKNMTAAEFSEKFCRSVDLGLAVRLSLVETPDHDCVFWDEGCTVYESRPTQCRTYPFWEANLASREDWDREARECPGMNQGTHHSRKAIAAALEARRRDVLISPSR